MERERFDGADIVHILRACAETMNWDRLLLRFEPYWQLLSARTRDASGSSIRPSATASRRT